MAVQRTGSGANANQERLAQAAAAAEATAPAATATQQTTQQSINVGQVGQQGGTPKAANYLQQIQGYHLGRTEAGEALVNAQRSIQEYLEEKGMTSNKNKDGLEYRVVPVDSNETSSFASAVAVVGILEGPESYAFCHTIVLEGSVQGNLPQVEVNLNGNTMHVNQALQDILDGNYQNRLRDVIASKLFLKGKVAMIDAGMSILPKSKILKTDTAEAKSIVSGIVFYAVSSINNERNKVVVGVPGLDLTQMNDGELHTSVDYTPKEHVRNAVGDPVRSDVRVVTNFSFRDAENRQRSVLMSDVSLAATVAYQPQQQGYGGAMPAAMGYGGQMAPIQNWVPTFTITRNDTGTPVVTLEQTLLGIAMAVVTLSDQLVWADVAYANRAKPHMNLGALPLMEGGEAVDLAAATVTPEEYKKFLYNFVQELPVFLYHVDRYDELGFANDPLLLAVNGDVNAVNDVYAALNNLCGGTLANIIPREKFASTTIGQVSPRLVPMGSYTPDNDAFAHDRREVDVLAILGSKMGNKLEAAQSLYAYDNDVSTDPQLRLSNRKRLEQDLLGSSLEDTGYAYEITLSPELMNILVAVIKGASMKVVKRLEAAQNGDRVFFNPTFRSAGVAAGLGSQIFSMSGLGGGMGMGTAFGNMNLHRGWN